ncbi:putative phage abortive infection protein [Mesorhizobium sp. M6A.T.Ce.TU.016.01.1.1]|uniref:putative phage abortive infection protein n=1 Tax=Mesorhizobium sp. M6A.T.Ce.TU.016.01.1.1 TaxID=2496783 RepID=UPI000FCC2072|nr:putative phage abortive infection protein [Mesorhizobium sp. M6A.T.Ce.TU.016.01.1.1]RUU25220.1 hypothetical protein EOC94_32445 [Mesorhizobium sp. M6A.T.Ce.TU.016.01.1.1]
MAEREETDSAPLWPVIVTLLLAAAAWCANLYYGLSLESDARGLFGDMFGAVNSVFSGFAFVGVIYAIFLQRHEISIAKKEIAYTKTILDEQQKQLSLQNQETKKQAFESTYFQMVRLFTDITNQIDLQKMGKSGMMVTKGKDAFPVFLERLRKAYSPLEKSLYGGHDFESSYEAFYQEHNTELGHYFRMLYNIVAFIDGAEIENQKFYAKILRAQLSDAEVAILFYNGLSQHGVQKFKPLMERYGLLKNLNERDVSVPELRERYKVSAFGNPAKDPGAPRD